MSVASPSIQARGSVPRPRASLSPRLKATAAGILKRSKAFPRARAELSHGTLPPVITDRIATRRGAWITVAGWAVLAVAFTVLAQKYPAPPPAFAFALPASAEASRADAVIARDFPHSNGTAATIVLHRPGGAAERC
jgi:hypothetical protein